MTEPRWLHPDSHVGMQHPKMSERVSIAFHQPEPFYWTPDGITDRDGAEVWWRKRMVQWVKDNLAHLNAWQRRILEDMPWT